ncbi:phosphoacetylglucosamine mutase PCM1 KNAG_0E00940 [Huiozyma naganishii CBS 8797]|uniref:Phosphoacetylglucosamine mutase n=1 Tax=Huiozyma naganishii (strain ATCC MYA-139 / BCRC 22969 / CBS 8797 / KCTC 17520 / NBRC 10181 / NCYC 3082 / Yp74L-3) TaxID=1071383 RepID=J7RYU8_HUIN7|nr:hypothetical protein KNAG_0E00940 [Kazachstania naganishii CBS 8797]CCK70362.1 hypothetical protein KNAG_0E00940 [Kazachstania naganishii CBS 8797]
MSREAVRAVFDAVCTTKGYTYTYGTAGFRDKAAVLDTVMFATGCVAVLRSWRLNGAQVGVMVTASHNPPEDNGVKVVDPEGGMLPEQWEPLATRLANLAANGTFDQWWEYWTSLVEEGNYTGGARLCVGHDTRESSPRLLKNLMDAALAVSGGSITISKPWITNHPQLHYLTSLQRDGVTDAAAYNDHFQGCWQKLFPDGVVAWPFDRLFIDTANGVGAVQLQQFFKGWAVDQNKFRLLNTDYGTPENLNVKCGADFVKTNHRLPSEVPDQRGTSGALPDLYCSFDGDADRIVFYFVKNKQFHLLDGDKISTLFAKFIGQLTARAGADDKLTVGVVQTAYANGNSTRYIASELGIPSACTKTGVKHLHHVAKTQYDIGIYFEANGHGTVVFSDKFNEVVAGVASTNDAASTLYHFSKLINQTVGDAIADMLGVLAVLIKLQWTPEVWGAEYTDLPNLLTKVVVPDRSIFETTDQERRLVSPEGLQEKIDACVGRFKRARSFVRASGTENAVRIYCEAEDPQEVQELSKQVTEAVLNSV